MYVNVSEGRNVDPLGRWKVGTLINTCTLTLAREDSPPEQGQQLRHQAYVTFEATGLDWTGTRRTWMRRAPPRSRSLLVVEERLVRSL